MILPGKRLFLILLLGIPLFVLNIVFNTLIFLVYLYYIGVIIVCVIDFRRICKKDDIIVTRSLEKYLSIGEFNKVNIRLENRSQQSCNVHVRDYFPTEFLTEDDDCMVDVDGLSTVTVFYHVKPFCKGEYEFTRIDLRVSSPLGFLMRQYKYPVTNIIEVYPNLIALKKYIKLTSKNRQAQLGYKKQIPGGENEFDFLREYQRGDLYKKVNWKATARKHFPIVEVDRKEQNRNIIAVLDSGRMMTTIYGHLSKLDYSIDASLILAAAALGKNDRFGLLSFSRDVEVFYKPQNSRNVLTGILASLKKIEARFVKSNYRRTYGFLKHKLRKNSIIFVFSEIYNAIVSKDLIDFLKLLSLRNRVFLVSFEEIEKEAAGKNYTDVIRWTFQLGQTVEKETIINELKKHGITTIRVNAQTITNAVVNSFLSV